MKTYPRQSLLFAFVCLFCCLASPRVHSETLTGAGATFPYPLYSRWFDAYKAARIDYQAIGSGAGIQELKRQVVDFGASDRPLANAESKDMPRPVVHIPTVGGAVAVVYNLPELRQQKKQLRLSGPVLAAIYLGEIAYWNDPRLGRLNPGATLPKRRITVTHRSAASGTTYIFTQYLSSVSRQWARQVGIGKVVDWPIGIGPKGSDGIGGLVRYTADAIGYIEWAYAQQNHLVCAAIRNRAGQFISPGVSGVIAAITHSAPRLRRDVRSPIVDAAGAASYPISGLTYILVPRSGSNTAKRTALLRFLRWTMTDGQRFAKPLLYAPLPHSLVQINQAKLRTLQ